MVVQCILFITGIFLIFILNLLVLYYCGGSSENSVGSIEVAKDDAVHARQSIENVSQSTFRSVAEISKGDDRSSGFATVDMVCIAYLSLDIYIDVCFLCISFLLTNPFLNIY